MLNIFNNLCFRTTTLCLCTTAFTTVNACPNLSYIATEKGTAEEACLALLTQELNRKIEKSIKKRDLSKVLDVLFDIKKTVENFTGIKIDIDSQLDTVEKKLKSSGVNVDKKDFKEVRKIIKKKHKRIEHRVEYMQQCLELGIDFNQENESLLYEMKHGKDDDKKTTVPVKLAYGVSLMCAGGFLCVIPITRPTGLAMMATGLSYATDVILDRWQEMEDEENKK